MENNKKIQEAIKKLDNLYPKDKHVLHYNENAKKYKYILTSPIINGFEIGGGYGHILKRFQNPEEFSTWVDEFIDYLQEKAEEDETTAWFSPLHKLDGIRWGKLPEEIQYYLLMHSSIWEEGELYSNERIIDFGDSWLSIGGEILPNVDDYIGRIKIKKNTKLYISTRDELFG